MHLSLCNISCVNDGGQVYHYKILRFLQIMTLRRHTLKVDQEYVNKNLSLNSENGNRQKYTIYDVIYGRALKT
jgi:hypothetical protein